MAIYDLNEIVTSAALGMYKGKWQNMDFEQVLQDIVQETDFTYSWEYGENWAIFCLNEKSVGMLCKQIPFAIIENEKLSQKIYQEYPWILTQQFYHFDTDKILLNKYVCKLTIGIMSAISQEPISLQDLYVDTV
ncbi:hypothetical protein [Neisseria meningitidis]|uniref:hypothetical protein n=1 Tax=Neisseria meningitidis TaxID=487 RepID=UPI000E567E35|nr:hypothetical protein [Neisseria meningitidis]